MRLLVDADDLHLHRLADREDLGRVVDAPPRHVGHVQQAVDAAEVDERTVVGDVLDHALDDLAFLERLDDLVPLLGAGLLQHHAAGHDDVAAPLVHLEDLERLRRVHQRADVAHRADVDLGTRQERHGAVEVDGETALHLVEDLAGDLLVLLERGLEADPRFLAAGLLARQDGLAERVLDALKIDLDLIADRNILFTGATAEFLQRNAAFHLEADVDDREVLLEGDHDALDHRAFDHLGLVERRLEEGREIVTGWGC